MNDDLFCFCVFVSYVWMEMKKLFSQRSTNTSVIINRQTCIFFYKLPDGEILKQSYVTCKR